MAGGRELGAKLQRLLGISPSGLVTLVAISSVLVMVSVPRLQGFALHQNERDALATTRTLAQCLEKTQDPQPRSIQDLVERAGLLRELDDAEFLEDGRLLRRHGYLFALGSGPPPTGSHVESGTVQAAAPGPGSSEAVFAWPWASGRTGDTALVGLPGRPALGHPNEAGRWSGPERPRSLESDWTGWRTVP